MTPTVKMTAVACVAAFLAAAVWLAGVLPARAEPVEPAIVGGEEATPGAWPWVAALVAASAADAFDGQFCGGSLIDPEWVLTAAHCVYEGGVTAPAGAIDVVVGRHQLSTDEGERIAIAEIIVHPAYNEFTSDNDFALLRLDQAASVSTISLAQATDSALVAAGTPATVIGWGRTAYGGDSSDVLRQVTVPVVAQAICDAAYGSGSITDNMICAGLPQGGKDSCQGDSGGPMIALHGDGAWRLIGVVSFGFECAAPGFPGVYSRVPAGYEWVAGNVPGLNAAAPLPEGVPVFIPLTRKAS